MLNFDLKLRCWGLYANLKVTGFLERQQLQKTRDYVITVISSQHTNSHQEINHTVTHNHQGEPMPITLEVKQIGRKKAIVKRELPLGEFSSNPTLRDLIERIVTLKVQAFRDVGAMHN